MRLLAILRAVFTVIVLLPLFAATQQNASAPTPNAPAPGSPPAAFQVHANLVLVDHQEIDLPQGLVYLRVVVHDLTNTKVGATEVPLVVAKE